MKRGDFCSKCGGPVKPEDPRPCRACNLASQARHRAADKEKDLERSRAYYHAHKEHRSRATAEWKKRNPEKCKAHSKKAGWKRLGILITMEQYAQLVTLQDGRCAICGTKQPSGQHGTFYVDHDHDYRHVRGLLCARCNLGVGLFEDSPTLLRAVAAYLDRNQPQLPNVQQAVDGVRMGLARARAKDRRTG